MNTIKKVLEIPLNFSWTSSLLLILLLLQIGIGGIIYFIFLLFSLLVHEYCHALAAIKNNIYVKEIVFNIFGATTFIDPKVIFNRNAGLKIALAGPIGSLVLAILLFLLTFFISEPILFHFCFINVVIYVFNLLPFFSFDGGKILYYLLSFIMFPIKAMKVVAIISYILSIIGIIITIIFMKFQLLPIFIFFILITKEQHKYFKMLLKDI